MQSPLGRRNMSPSSEMPDPLLSMLWSHLPWAMYGMLTGPEGGKVVVDWPAKPQKAGSVVGLPVRANRTSTNIPLGAVSTRVEVSSYGDP